MDLRLSQHAEQCHHVERWFTYKVDVRRRCRIHLESCQQSALREEVRVVTEESIVVAQERKFHFSAVVSRRLLVLPSTLVRYDHLQV